MHFLDGNKFLNAFFPECQEPSQKTRPNSPTRNYVQWAWPWQPTHWRLSLVTIHSVKWPYAVRGTAPVTGYIFTIMNIYEELQMISFAKIFQSTVFYSIGFSNNDWHEIPIIGDAMRGCFSSSSISPHVLPWPRFDLLMTIFDNQTRSSQASVAPDSVWGKVFFCPTCPDSFRSTRRREEGRVESREKTLWKLLFGKSNRPIQYSWRYFFSCVLVNLWHI